MMTSVGSTTKVYSIQKIAPKTRMRAIEIGGPGECDGIILSQPNGLSNSPLFDSEKNCRGWVYSMNSTQEVPFGKIWILVPSEWKIKSRVGGEIILGTKTGKIRSIFITKQLEGFDVLIKSSNHEGKGYYYLGYDIQ
jgi:hypothetical protein